jgi:hypothetical protein
MIEGRLWPTRANYRHLPELQSDEVDPFRTSRFNYRFGRWGNKDISFFFLSQLILPPVVLAMPFLVLYKALALLDTRIGLILVYTLMVLPIIIWGMHDQFERFPRKSNKPRWSTAAQFGGVPPGHPADCAARHGRRLHPVDRALLTMPSSLRSAAWCQ